MSPFNLAVIAAGLGFLWMHSTCFCSVFTEFPALTRTRLTGDALKAEGEKLLAVQMLGMMIGGILTGIIGDRKGRVAVLFGSILLYSAANIANAFVGDTTSYAIIRFLAGVIWPVSLEPELHWW
ncbi:MAG: MFS transporter [Bacteroidetes bacterium]|nr:MFS transporter [Bacteroidota bacterium]